MLQNDPGDDWRYLVVGYVVHVVGIFLTYSIISSSHRISRETVGWIRLDCN